MGSKEKVSIKERLLDTYPDVLTLDDLRKLLGIKSTKTASKWIRENEIFHFRIGNTYRIPKFILLEFFKSQN